MPVCPSCNRDVLESARFCPDCGAALPRPAPAAAPAATAAETIPQESSPHTPPSSSSIHGRFEPGTRLGARYRIVGLLGRGGMGEVYRADDLELGQSVALKFLPEKVSRNAADLARLRSEVRTARQVAHPNVCRTYDISEAEGQVFVVMEYIDGEDLSSVLRRLGRPSPDKALEIARQLCLGLGAAHENGVLHRDLKPANIMIDGRGRARITDFGLAGTAAEIAAEGVVAGTPAYMAPEQLRTGVASVQSDIYALGLVLHEVFTGKRVTDTTPRLDRARPGSGSRSPSDSSVRTPSSLTPDIDPAVERVILRCLEQDPARRPHSAYAVFGALPGGDPLAAAVAAGETPSPELVANAGVEGSVRPLIAGIGVAAALAGVVVLSLTQGPLLTGLDRSVKVLSVRAEEMLTEVSGTVAPQFSEEGFRYAPVAKAPSPADSAAAARATAGESTKPRTQGPKQYWRRWSPVPLVARDLHEAAPKLADPPQTYPGSATLILDTRGRLLALSVVPNPSTDSLAGPLSRAIDWVGLLRAAGRDTSGLAPVAPPSSFVVLADTVSAWRVPGAAGADTTIVAAAFQGRIIQADTYVGGAPLGDLFVRHGEKPTSPQNWGFLLALGMIPLIGSIFLASRNLKSGRGDIRGALSIGIVVAVLYLIEHLLAMRPTELGFYRVLEALTQQGPMGHALLHGVGLTLAYLAIEPYARRLWPVGLVTWARLVTGRLRDPIVGRDILVGVVWAVGVQLLEVAQSHLDRRFGFVTEPLQASPLMLEAVLGPVPLIRGVVISLAVSFVQSMTLITLLVILRFVTRSNRATVIGAVVLLSFLFLEYGSKTFPVLGLAFNFVVISTTVLLLLRYGFVAMVIAWFIGNFSSFAPWATDLDTWFAPQTILSWVIIGALLAYGFVTAVGGRSLFKDPLSEA